MSSWKPLIIFFWGITFIIIISGCSPSSYSSRYKKPVKENNGQKRTKAVRFSSKNEENPKSKKNKTTYSNVPKISDEATEEYPVDISNFIKKHHRLKEFGSVLTHREKMLFEIISYIDTPYKYGGNSKQGIDCSAFTQNVFSKTAQSRIPRTAREQYNVGHSIKSISNLKFGDLVFFDTIPSSYPGHVGIYIGDSLFAHSSGTKGVTISSLESKYYLQRFVGGKRVQDFE